MMIKHGKNLLSADILGLSYVSDLRHFVAIMNLDFVEKIRVEDAFKIQRVLFRLFCKFRRIDNRLISSIL
jgi:hypothetical protein